MPSDENTKNIIIDYTFTGSTLQAVKNLIISNNITPENSTKALSIDALFFDLGEKEAEIFEQICEGAKDDRKMLEHVYFNSEKDMIENKIADLSNIPHNKYNAGEYTPYEEKVKKFNEYSQPLARCFNLCILNELDKIKLHLENSI